MSVVENVIRTCSKLFNVICDIARTIYIIVNIDNSNRGIIAQIIFKEDNDYITLNYVEILEVINNNKVISNLSHYNVKDLENPKESRHMIIISNHISNNANSEMLLSIRKYSIIEIKYVKCLDDVIVYIDDNIFKC